MDSIRGAQTIQVWDSGQPRTYQVPDKAAAPQDQTLLREDRRGKLRLRHLTPDVLVHLASNADAAATAAESGATAYRVTRLRKDHYLFQAADAASTLKLVEKLRQIPNVLGAEPVLARQRVRKFIPSDPLFTNQWHLVNRGGNGALAGIDLHLTNTWDTYRGQGIVIGIVDDGVDLAHPDLAAHIDPSLGYDWNDRDNNPSPHPTLGDFHGTECAGCAAAIGNNGAGVTGVAFEATLAALRLISLASTDITESEAILFKNQQIDIKSNSWGPDDDGQTLEGPGPLATAALAESVRSGRGGKGTIFVWAAGNGLDVHDNANYDGYANSIYTIAVGSISDQGQQTDFSEPGACVVLVTPSGSFGRPSITTTDLQGAIGVNKTGLPDDYADLDYTSTFVGTSASTAIAAGGIALILNANPNLGWRDMQEILLRSSTVVDEHDSDWDVNAAGIHVNHKYGAGLMNIDNSVALARGWQNLAPQTNLTVLQTNLNLAIPDNDPNGVTVNFDLSQTSLRVEQVTLTASIAHSFRGNLAITLTSPSGMQSRLAELHNDPGSNYVQWTFMSVRHWGETSQGNWQVRVADLQAGDTGAIQSLELNLYGTPTGPPNPIVLDSLQFSDAPFGNGNGAIEPGEIISCQFLLHNTSTALLSGTAQVRSRTPGVELLAASSTLSLSPGSSGQIAASFRIAPEVPCQSTLLFDLITDSGGVLRTNTLRQKVGPPPAVWSLDTVDNTRLVGYYTSLALDSLGQARISYYDAGNGALKYARETDAGWQIETVDHAGNVGTYTSLALDSSGRPRISYRDEAQQRLKYAAWDGAAWQIQTVPTTVNAGSYSSLKLTRDGAPRIAFMDETNGDLLYAQWVEGSWHVETVDSADKTGSDLSLALTPQDQPMISYRNATLGDLKFAEWTGAAWAIVTVDSDGLVGNNSSLRIGRDGEPRIAYRDTTHTDLKFARRSGAAWTTETVDTTRAVGFDASLALDSQDRPRISYRDLGNNTLKFAAWNGAFWAIEVADATGAVGAYTSLALTPADAPRISYRDTGNSALKYARLDTPQCDLFTGGPQLTLTVTSGTLLLTWPASPIPLHLESAPALTHPIWTPSTLPITQAGTSNTTPISPDNTARYYRLRTAP